jgi:thiamine-phosphate pyrophosphorylase
VAHARDVAIVIDNHLLLAERLGLDGVHLTDGARSVRKAARTWAPMRSSAPSAASAGHEGMSAGEAGADYVAFGPSAKRAGRRQPGDFDVFEWWSEVIEVPVIAEGALTAELVARFGPVTDFFAVGEEIWGRRRPAGRAEGACCRMGWGKPRSGPRRAPAPRSHARCGSPVRNAGPAPCGRRKASTGTSGWKVTSTRPAAARQHLQQMAAEIHVAPPAIEPRVLAAGRVKTTVTGWTCSASRRARREEGGEKRALERQHPDRVGRGAFGKEQKPVARLQPRLEQGLLPWPRCPCGR